MVSVFGNLLQIAGAVPQSWGGGGIKRLNKAACPKLLQNLSPTGTCRRHWKEGLSASSQGSVRWRWGEVLVGPKSWVKH